MEAVNLIDLPPGYKAFADPCVGFSYMDECGNIVAQHPRDANVIRQLLWQEYKNRQDAQLQRTS